MSRHVGAAARRAPAHRRPAVAPPRPRRVSGPAVARPALVGAGRGAVRGLPDSGFLDKLLRSRAWIWLIGLLLGGIVAMQVSLLKLNHGISRAVESTATLERQTAALEAEIARLSSGERIRAAAMRAGMVMPEAGSVAYLTLREGDARRAATRMQAPSEQAKAVMQRGGLAEPAAVAPVAPVPTTDTAAPATTVAPQETAPVPPAPTATPAPVPTQEPAATATGGAAPGEG